MHDLRFALRALRRRPLFAGVAILTLGLGIGATTAMFSVVDGVLLGSTPFRRPSELVHVWRIARGAQGSPGLVGRTWDRLPLRGDQFVEVQARNRVFDGVASHNAVDGTITGGGAARRVKVGNASASLLQVLGVRVERGRWFLPEEVAFAEGAQAAPVVVVSEEFWQEQLGGDPGVLGSTLELDRRTLTIIGVLPRGFRLRYLGMHWLGEDRRGYRDLWVPFGSGYLVSGGNKETIARLAPGATTDQARQDVQGILASLEPDVEVRIVPRTNDATLGLGSPLLLLLAAAAMLLVIACLNTATLYLGELQGRTRELATRAALGAGRLRVARQLLTESLVVGLLGGLLGVFLAFGGTRALVAVAPPLPRVEHVGVDVRVLGVTGLLAVLAGLLFGTVPAWVSASRTSHPSLRASRGASQRRWRLDGILLTVQLALTVVVLVAGGLLGRSLGRLMEVDPGFEPDGLAMVHVTLPGGVTGDDIERYYDATTERLRAVPGVAEVSAATRLPFPGLTNTSTFPITRDDGSVADASAQSVGVLDAYHEMMGIPVIAGRGFTPADRQGSEPVLIVTENFARRYWPDRSPIGERVRFNGERTVVGITGDVKRNRLGVEPDPVAYTPLRQVPREEVKFVVRAEVSGREIPLGEIRDAVQGTDPDMPVIRVASMGDLIAESATDERYRTMLMGVFGLLAAFLAAVGIFGVTARGVSQRTRELGIRMALGARVRGLTRLVVRGSISTGLLSAALGLLGAFWTSRSLAGFLFGVEPFDPLVFLTVGSGTVLLALIASYVPARRIVSIDPATVLRAE